MVEAISTESVVYKPMVFLKAYMPLPQIPELLIEEIKSRNCVLFVGAGLSKGSGLPDWPELLRRLIDFGERNGVSFPDRERLFEIINNQNGDLLDVADQIEESLSTQLFDKALTRIVRDDNYVPSPIHRLIPQIPFASIITTNYDKLIEAGYFSRRPIPPPIINNNNSVLTTILQEHRFYILKAHGDIDDPETIVLGKKSYERLLKKNRPYTEHFKTIFKTRSVLFMGFSLVDPDFQSMIKRESVISKRRGNTTLHFALMPASRIDSVKREEFEREYGIRILSYEPGDKSHPEVEEFLRHLISKSTPPVSEPDNRSLHSGGPEHSPENSPAEAIKESADGENINEEISNQVTEVVEALGHAITVGYPVLDEFQSIRLQLLSTTIVERKIPGAVLGTHESNRLYLFREKLAPLPLELTSLLRMLVKDDAGYVPGWFWFEKYEDRFIEGVIFRLAHADDSNSVRESAFKLLSNAKISLLDDAREQISLTVTSDSSPNVRQAVLSYLGQVAGPDYLPIVGSGLVDNEEAVCKQAKLSKLLILARSEPNRTLRELLEEPDVDVERVTKELRKRSGEILTETLITALEAPQNVIRLFSAEELQRRGNLTIEIATNLKEDKDDSIKSIAFSFLVNHGSTDLEPNDICFVPDNYIERRFARNLSITCSSQIDREEIVLNYYRKYSFDDLMTKVGWENYYGADVYLALAVEHFADFGDQLREDLQSDFRVLAEKYYANQLEEYRHWDTRTNRTLMSTISRWSPQTERTPEERARESVESEKVRYVRAALVGLNRDGEPGDLEFARHYLNHSDYDVRIEAVRMVNRWGNEKDLSDLIKIAKNDDGLLQELATKTALAISYNSFDVSKELLSTGNAVLISITIAQLISSADTETTGEFLKNYLWNEDDEIRTRAMAFYIFRYNDEALEKLLTEYTGQETYYYDVVTCFDRFLYAPSNVRSFYRKAVSDKFWGMLDAVDVTVSCDEPTTV